MLGQLGGGLSLSILGRWDVFPIGLGFVCTIPVLELDTVNLSGSGSNVNLLCGWGLLHHGCEV